MQNNVIIYTKDNCSHCINTKNFLQQHQKTFTEVNIGTDITREDFISIFPNVKSVPHIIINGEQIGGFDKLTEWLGTDTGLSFLAE